MTIRFILLISAACPRRAFARQVHIYIGINNIPATVIILRCSRCFKNDIPIQYGGVLSVCIDIRRGVTAYIQCILRIDRQIALDDIANAKGIDFDEMLDEVEAIVYSGTKLNIDYFLDEVMDEDHVDDIYDYFMESDTDSLQAAIDELGDDYSEDEIRLVRIKFISEMAN